MRAVAILLAAVSLAACDAKPIEPKAAAPLVITYDGAITKDPAALVNHGERMATMVGCTGCHGENLQGQNVTSDDPGFGDMNAPNITLLLAKYDDSTLDKLIRHGMPRDGREFWFMPSEVHQFVADLDYAALVAFLRTVKPAGKPMPPIRKGPDMTAQVKAGDIAASTEMIRRFKASQPTDLGPGHALGRYIAMTTCTECHNSKLQGYPGFSPDLDIAGSYSTAELTTLLTTGEGKVRKDLGLMSATARHRFARLTPNERAAVIAYIKARVDRPQ